MSIPNSLLRIWAARLASKVAICSAVTYDLYHLSKARAKDGSIKLAVSDDRRRLLRTSSAAKKDSRTVEDVFIESLVAAGSCKHLTHGKRVSLAGGATRTPGAAKMRKIAVPSFNRLLSTCAQQRHVSGVASPDQEISREEYKQLVDTYSSPSNLWENPEHIPRQAAKPSTPRSPVEPPADKANHIPLAPRLVIPPEQEILPPLAKRIILEAEDQDHRSAIRDFRRLLQGPLGYMHHIKLWDKYESLRIPRLRYLANDDIRRAFRHLSWVEYRHDEAAMQRYFSLLEECIAEGIHVKTAEWNTAIAFAGRWVRWSTSSEVKYAIETWMRMENHGKRANNITFNILFDVAVKGGRFALADTIFDELKARGMPLNRYFRTSMIYYQGIRGDGEAVRQAFRDLVNQGEIVDTVVMNCVILSLIRAGEPAAAENVFSRMKSLVEQKLGLPSSGGWREDRILGALLGRTAKRLRDEKQKHERSFFGSQFADERRDQVQKITPISPNGRTYSILIQHHAYTSGDIGRIRSLLGEMKSAGWRVRGALYIHLFRGYWTHGGQAYTAWNRASLQILWDELLAATEQSSSTAFPRLAADVAEDARAAQSEEDRSPYFSRPLVHAAIRAWYKCAGTKKVLAVWREVQERWKDCSDDDRIVIESLVHKLELEDSVYL
ncbi:hypothetical protein LTR62_007402 [Meristemomyces frigidus]|uniref:Pentatricopeptide repeat-containing protein n=1 Tax=Meristemomyces frigidus TaxID=1508187 RepID=A0AAN7TIB6_9PEZI|nr:hypothetical protein LTR62_007402 [Meristemomyces frigidus]